MPGQCIKEAKIKNPRFSVRPLYLPVKQERGFFLLSHQREKLRLRIRQDQCPARALFLFADGGPLRKSYGSIPGSVFFVPGFC